MKVLMLTIPFAPKLGGVETVVELLSRALVEKSHHVCVATMQPSNGEDHFPFVVLRRPSAFQLLRAFWHCDQVIFHGPTLRLGWPAFLVPRRAWLVHHIWPPADKAVIKGFVRKLLYWRCKHLAVSRALAAAVPAPATVIANPFDHSKFQTQGKPSRDRDLIFLGRLVPLKGVED